jgi:alkylation response protein AidB-like acyl-CoA dehydrogenase
VPEPDLLPAWAASLIASARTSGTDVASAVQLSRRYGALLPLPGGGDTATRWRVLAALGRVNLTVARVYEAHTDALAILAESGAESPAGLAWGVFAAEAPGATLEAAVTGGTAALSGVKPWCSLGGALDAALVTARVGDQHRLFRVDLHHPSVRADPPECWVARGLRTVTSGPVRFEHTPAQPVGEPGWYLVRRGFAWGGIGVAACWHGGAQGLADTVRQTAARRSGDLNALHLGIIDAALHGSAAVLATAARLVDRDDVDSADADADVDVDVDAELLALRTRAVVADTIERVLHQAGHALGPGPLAFDDDYATRVADLQLYVRQHHGERDLATLGKRLLDEDNS